MAGGGAPYGPWIQILDGGADTPRFETFGRSTLPGARLALFQEVTEVLRRRAEARGLVVVLEDLDAADEASLRLLQHLIEDLSAIPLLVVATYADDRRPLLAALARLGRRIRLPGLNEEEVGQLLAREVGPGRAGEVARSVHHATDGNPFYVLRAGGQLAASAGPATAGLPLDVRSLLRDRLGTVPPEVRETLMAAAVLGDDFDLATLAALCGAPADGALCAGADFGVVEEAEAGRWAFTHELFREGLYQELRPSARIALHRRAAEVIGGDRVFERAHHAFQAARGGEGRPAVDAELAAGHRAMESLALEEAAGHYGRALDALALVTPVDERRRFVILCALAECLEHSGETVQAGESWRRALASARKVSAADHLAEAALGYARAVAPGPQTASVLEEARAALPSADSPLLARLLAALALARGAPQVAEEAVAMARRLDDRSTLTTALAAYRDCLGTPEARLPAAGELLALAESSGDPERTAQAALWMAADLFGAGDVDAALHHLDASRAAGAPLLTWAATAQEVGPTLLRGRLDEAERLAGEAAVTGARLGLAEVDERFQAQLRRIDLERGRFEDASARGRAGRTGPDCLQADLGVSDFHRGRADDARRALEAMVPSQGAVAGRLCCLAAAADLCWLVADADRAAMLAEALRPHDEAHVVEAVSGCSRGAAARHLGQLATLQGRLEEAEVRFAAAHRLHEGLGAPAWLARSQADEARMLLLRGGPGDRDRARAVARTAAETFADLGMDFFAGLARALVQGEATGPAEAVDRARLTQTGDDWAFEYAGTVVRLRDGKGVRYLVALLRQPGCELHALQLTGAALRPADKERYRRQLENLREELDEATVANDIGRASRAQDRMDDLLAELSAAVGQGRSDQRATADAERARQSVTRAVKSTVERLAQANPALGRHLRSTVRTGVYSAYVPDPRAPIAWEEGP